MVFEYQEVGFKNGVLGVCLLYVYSRFNNNMNT